MSRKRIHEHLDYITEQAVTINYTTSSEKVRAADFHPKFLDNKDKRQLQANYKYFKD